MENLLIGKKAPKFKAKAAFQNQVIENFSLDLFKEKYIVLFFYPLDFTFVCPTELHAFQQRIKDFEEKETVVIGCSVDSVFTHLAYLKTPKSEGGIKGITYPLISDLDKNIARSYHVLSEEEGIAYRGLFLIDQAGIIRHQLINDLPLGRSVNEVLRLLEALIFHKKHGQVCPANWNKGEKTMDPTSEGLAAYFS